MDKTIVLFLAVGDIDLGVEVTLELFVVVIIVVVFLLVSCRERL